MTGSPLRSAGGVDGGMQVAAENMSTNFKMKNLGKVPPRFDTLLPSPSVQSQLM